MNLKLAQLLILNYNLFLPLRYFFLFLTKSPHFIRKCDKISPKSWQNRK